MLEGGINETARPRRPGRRLRVERSPHRCLWRWA